MTQFEYDNRPAMNGRGLLYAMLFSALLWLIILGVVYAVIR